MADTNWTLCFPRASSTPMVVESPKPTTVPLNHLLLKIDRFGFSANNVTYQAMGEHPNLRYYDFYPAPTNKTANVSPETHGVVPVWGLATVLLSAHPKIQVGERLYGYFAPTKYLVIPIDEKDVNKYAIYVPRPQFPPNRRLYHQILRCSTDPLYTTAAEDLMMLYRPLFWTSYWCEDWLFCSGYHGGCDGILISSASSKTAFCFAYCIKNRISRGKLPSTTKIVGLTSKKNVEFTKRLGLYHEVYDYDSLKSNKFEGRWIYTDVTGNNDLNRNVVDHFDASGTKLVLAISLGMTTFTPESASSPGFDWNADESTSNGIMQDTSSQASTPKPASTPVLQRFFTPEWVDVRRKQLPLTEIFEMQRTEWHQLMKDCVGWVEIERVYGSQAVKRSYEKIASEGVGPDKGLVWSLWEKEESERVGSKL